MPWNSYSELALKRTEPSPHFFTKRLIGLPFSGLRIVREQDVDQLKLSLRGNTLSIDTSGGTFALKGVDLQIARQFVDRARSVAARGHEELIRE